MFQYALAAALAIASPALGSEGVSRTINPPVGSLVEVTPGQRFYADFYTKSVPAYRVEPFKSSMGGSMGLPFSFAIDSEMLQYAGRSKDGRWSYFVPAKFRASHGLLGSVISEGDTVGLRVSDSGQMEWFVDNSIHNGMPTIWSRKVKDKDPQPTLVQSGQSESAGLPMDRLFYLGVEGGRVRIRHEQVRPGGNTIRDEFSFPVDSSGKAVGAVKGAEFAIQAGPLRAQVVVTTPMTTELGEMVR